MPIPRTILADAPLTNLDLVLRSGEWPAGLRGEVFIATSDRETAPRHAFFGDGSMIRLSLEPGTHGAAVGTFAWRPRILGTPSRLLRERHPDLFEATAAGTRSPFGSVNAANTAPLPWGNRLFATWDAGRPVEVDPVSLGFLGEVGDRRSWGPDAFDSPVLPLYPSSVHPVIDPERGCMWSVVSSPISGELAVVRYDGASTRVQRWPLAGASLPQSMHTVGQTRNWLVLIDCAFRVDPDELFELGERRVTNFTDEPVFLVRKDALEAARNGDPVEPTTLRLAPEANHYYPMWDDSDGICVIVEHTPNTDLAMWMRADDFDALGRRVDPRLRGMYNHPMHHGVIAEVRIDPEAGVITCEARYEDPAVAFATQLSAIDWSVEGMTSPQVHHQLFTGYRPEAISRRALDLYAARVDRAALPTEETPSYLVTMTRGGLDPKAAYTFALDDYASSPCFVPAPAPAGYVGRSRYAGANPGGEEGWVVVPVLNDDGFRVEVFDAANVAAGPVAVLGTPQGETVPFLIHSAWMPEANPSDPSIQRLRFADDLDPARVASLPEDLAQSVRVVADALP